MFQFYGELKVAMETIQQQIAKVNNNERIVALKKVKELRKGFVFTAWMLRGELAEGGKTK